jgi:putative ABC transport system permease protein
VTDATLHAGAGPGTIGPVAAGATAVRRGQGLLELPFVLSAAGRDLVWRARRWTIATLGTALVFALTLLLSAFLASFTHEVTRTIDVIGGDGYVVRAGAQGPFTAPTPLQETIVEQLRADPGVTRVSPLVSLAYVAQEPGRRGTTDVYLVGREADGPGHWPITEGRPPSAPGEVVVDGRVGVDIGGPLMFAKRTFTVVGHTSGLHVIGGRGLAWMGVADAQTLLFGGQPIVSGFVVDGRPTQLPPGTAFADPVSGRADFMRLVTPVMKSIRTFRLLMWIVAAASVGSVLYLTALERVRDFAVFKATGTRDRELVASLLVQATLLALVSSVLAVGLANLIAPTLPSPALFTGKLYMTAPLVAVLIGAIGSIAGIRRAISADPAVAFGGP